MSYDIFTISAIVIVVVLSVVVVLLTYQKALVEKRLRNVAGQMYLIHVNERARELCAKISKSHPGLCPGLDYTMKRHDGKIVIDEWDSDKPKPEE